MPLTTSSARTRQQLHPPPEGAAPCCRSRPAAGGGPGSAQWRPGTLPAGGQMGPRPPYAARAARHLQAQGSRAGEAGGRRGWASWRRGKREAGACFDCSWCDPMWLRSVRWCRQTAPFRNPRSHIESVKPGPPASTPKPSWWHTQEAACGATAAATASARQPRRAGNQANELTSSAPCARSSFPSLIPNSAAPAGGPACGAALAAPAQAAQSPGCMRWRHAHEAARPTFHHR